MRVNFYLKKTDAEYETWIFISVAYAGNRLRIYTDEKIHPQFWNAAKQRVRQTLKFPTNPEFNTRLDNIENKIKNVYRKWKIDNGEQNEPSGATLTNLIKQELGKNPEQDKTLLKLKTFWGFFENFIERSKTGVRLHKGEQISKATIVNYQNLFNGLKKYEKIIKRKLDFDSFDIHFYNQYYTHLVEQNFATNSIGKRISNLKLMLREAYEDGYSKNTIFNHSKFKVTQETVETTYLNNEEINEMYNLDLSNNKRLEKVRDAFVIGCYTGLRFSDVSKLKMDDIKDGIIEIVQTKTGNPVAIPLRQQVMEIIEKYNNNFPKVISNQKFNQYLRELCQKCTLLQKEVSIMEVRGGIERRITKPKYEFISTHTARRSFATNEFLAKDIKTYQIMAITGHRTEKSFYRYIRLTREENARDIANIWQEREKKQAIVKPHRLTVVKAVNQ